MELDDDVDIADDMMLANGIEQAVEDAGAEVVELDEEADYRKLRQLPQRIEVTPSHTSLKLLDSLLSRRYLVLLWSESSPSLLSFTELLGMLQ